jgi:DNA polymerase-3 subunit epsilon
MMPKLPTSIIAVDVETTGLTSEDRIVTLGAWRINLADLQGDALQVDCIHVIADPGRRSHPKAEQVHGYSDWVLRHQQPFSEHANAVRDFLSSGDLVIAHNASFDLSFIRREYLALGEKLPNLETCCTMDEYRRARLPGRASLNAICEQMGLSRLGERHGALEDAWLALMIFFWLRKLPAKHIQPFAKIAKNSAPVVPYNYKEPPVLTEGQVPPRRRPAAAASQKNKVPSKTRDALLRSVRPSALLLLEVARASASLAREEIDIIVSLIRATRDRLGLPIDDETEFEVLSDIFNTQITQNLMTRSARALCEDSVARAEFPRWLASIATADGSVSEDERAAIDRVKAAINRVLG